MAMNGHFFVSSLLAQASPPAKESMGGLCYNPTTTSNFNNLQYAGEPCKKR